MYPRPTELIIKNLLTVQMHYEVHKIGSNPEVGNENTIPLTAHFSSKKIVAFSEKLKHFAAAEKKPRKKTWQV